MEYPTWFKNVGGPATFSRNIGNLAGKPIKVLQIGAFTGDATEWIIKNILTHPESTLTDVDPWTGSDEPAHKTLDWKSVEDYYTERHQESIDSGKLIKVKAYSDDYFESLPSDEKFDVIYIDGDHKASTVLRDGINALKHLAPNGIIGFDDYNWTLGKGPAYDPKTAIEAIFRCNQDTLDVVDIGHQFWVKVKN